MVQVLGLLIIGKVLTGPWMELFYAYKANKKNLETEDDFDMAIASLEAFKKDPSTLLACVTDVFGRPLDLADKVLISLRAEPENPLFGEVVETDHFLNHCPRMPAQAIQKGR